ncbi:hypothetical protein SDC9_185528 [bioreactor metagenome]|uniref:Uncharacterized protein n=1 Tax=bioreactor metagenome TaxID=1076179 RepID=A0A645HHF1_9ZZZZ
MLPNLFFTARTIRYAFDLSPSKERTASTICSKSFGPAIAPSLFICPTNTVAISEDFASEIKAEAACLTCVMLPAEDDNPASAIVWIESTIRISGLSSLISDIITSSSVSQKMKSLSFSIPSLSARSLICERDSSPETYNIFLSKHLPAI